jgi:isopenicillin-N N-acyltransferase-like protein
MFTFTGLTSFMGLNSSGVSHFGNSLPWGWCDVAIPHYPIKWRIYQEKSLAGVRRLLDGTRTVQPGNAVMADGDGNIADVELTPERAVWLDPTDGFFVHTNHFLGAPYANRADLPPILEDSVPRLERITSLVRQAGPKLDVEKLKSILSDHENYPVSICRHAERMCTSASLIAEPERGLMHVCAGNPCDGDFVTYQV